MVNMKSMMKRVQSLVETDDELYGVVICNLLGPGLYSEVSHSDQVLLLHSDLGPEPEQLQSMPFFKVFLFVFYRLFASIFFFATFKVQIAFAFQLKIVFTLKVKVALFTFFAIYSVVQFIGNVFSDANKKTSCFTIFFSKCPRSQYTFTQPFLTFLCLLSRNC